MTAGRIANHLDRSVASLAPHLSRLIDAGFVVRHSDPIRTRRPRYALADPFLQFHYAILEPSSTLLRERDIESLWTNRLGQTFRSAVRGRVFEEQARTWVRRYASPRTLGGEPVHVGPSSVSHDGIEHELDILVAGAGEVPGDREVIAIGEAKSGEEQGRGHLRALERARTALGQRAVGATLLCVGPRFSADLVDEAAGRSDVELIDLERLYRGT